MGKKTVSTSKRERKGKKISGRDRINVITPEDSEVSGDEGYGGGEEESSSPKIWLPGMELGKDEVLEPDMSVYVMLQEVQMEWPCLSFDTLHDGSGNGECLDFPLNASLVAGTQADRPEKNKMFVMRWSNLRKNQSRDYEDEDADSSSSEEEGEDGMDNNTKTSTTKTTNKTKSSSWMPRCQYRTVSHAEGAGINRIRALQSPDASKLVVATWSERGKVFLWDLSSVQGELIEEGSGSTELKLKPLFVVDGHRDEGFAMDWSRREWGNLLSGDCAGGIYWTQLDGSGGTTVNGTAFTGHSGSVEDLQWSPSESTVFASSSTDQTVRIWDIRCDPRRPVLSAHCHESDVNVISWNRNVSYLLASGADDGTFKTWDLRNFSHVKGSFENTLSAPVATFKWHLGPVTSIEWHPSESSVLAVSGADDQISLWDFAVERDQEQQSNTTETDSTPLLAPNGMPIPPHLLFVHQGQKEVKEIHWHPQSPGVILSTAASGFNIFKTISI
jgi:ribosome assembly protein RRB1